MAKSVDLLIIIDLGKCKISLFSCKWGILGIRRLCHPKACVGAFPSSPVQPSSPDLLAGSVGTVGTVTQKWRVLTCAAPNAGLYRRTPSQITVPTVQPTLLFRGAVLCHLCCSVLSLFASWVSVAALKLLDLAGGYCINAPSIPLDSPESVPP